MGPESATRRVFFWGGKKLGYRCFARLVEYTRTHPQVEIVGVCVSEGDLPYDRSGTSPIVALAEEIRVPVCTTRDDVVADADVGLAVGYPHVIPASTLERFRDGALNLHMGPLPHYRGSKTLVHAILNGERRYGVSLHYMDAGVDTGDVVAVRWMDLPDDRSARYIMGQLVEIGFDLVDGYLPRILSTGRLNAVPQADLVAAGVVPRYYTRASVAPLYRLSADWDFGTLYRHTRALTTGNGKAPYLEDDGRRIYLSTEPPASHEEV